MGKKKNRKTGKQPRKPTPTRKAPAPKAPARKVQLRTPARTPAPTPIPAAKVKKEFPERVPFWARFKPSKNRTTLVIDRERVPIKKTKRTEEGFVHREATHSARDDYELISPNPDKTDSGAMYLKRPTKKPVRMFEAHNKDMEVPAHLQKLYEKNNKKKK